MQFSEDDGDVSGDLLLDNVEIFDGRHNLGRGYVFVDRGKIVSVGIGPFPKHYKSRKIPERVDGEGLFTLPGFIDSHLHLFALAAHRVGHDLSRLSEINQTTFETVLRQTKENCSVKNGWYRFYGLDSFQTALSGCLNRTFLDDIFPTDPVIVRFRSGHGALLNSVALSAIGVGDTTDEPNGVTFARNIENGQLTGVILEGEELFSSQIPHTPIADILQSLSHILEDLPSNGITTIVDATFNNDISKMEILGEFLGTNLLGPDVVLMPGVNHFRDFYKELGKYSDVHRGINIGHVKIMLTASAGRIMPDELGLSSVIEEAHLLGFPVAIHAVEKESVALAISALKNNFMEGDRIEHASELTDKNITDIVGLGIRICSQPSFITDNGGRYLREIEDTSLLYRFESLRVKGATVSFSSDAPFSRAHPMEWISAAVSRKIGRSGEVLQPEEKIPVDAALNMATRSSAVVSGMSNRKGCLYPGMDADILLLDANPFKVTLEELPTISPVLTLRRGVRTYSQM